MSWDSESTMASFAKRDQSSFSCCFEPISRDLEAKLQKSLAEVGDLRSENNDLSQELARKAREVEQLKCENTQLKSQRKNAEDHSVILSTKSDILKKDLTKSQRKVERLKSEIEHLETENKSLRSISERSRQKTTEMKSSIDRLGFEASKVATLQAENSEKQAKIEELELFLEEERSKTENLRLKINKLLQAAQAQANASDEIEVIQKRLMQSEEQVRSLQTEKLDMEMKLKTYEAQMPLLDDLKARVRDESNVQSLEREVQRLREENQALKQSNESLECDGENLQKLRAENCVLKGQIEALTLVKTRADKLETENAVLNEKAGDFELLREKSQFLAKQNDDLTKENARLTAKIRDLESAKKNQDVLTCEMNTLQAKLHEAEAQQEEVVSLREEVSHLKSLLLNKGTKSDREAHDARLLVEANNRIKTSIITLENEIHQRDLREQHLSTKYKYYKARSREQQTRIEASEAELMLLRDELMRLREREAMKEAALRRKRRHEKYSDDHRYQLIRSLEEERTRNVRLESQLENMKRRVSYTGTP